MKEKIINNANDFHEMVISYHSKHPIYRGVKNSAYDLISRIGRIIIINLQRPKGYKISKNSEIDSLNKYKKLSVPYLKHVPTNDWESMAVAQHHGLPTRMMDWTTNPLVAAFFACTDYLNTADAAIYVLEEEYDLNEASLKESPFDITSTTIFRPHHTTLRITAQSGLFTVHPTPKNFFEHKDLHKWIIKNECLIEIITMLSVYGVNDASMFPGLDGIAKSITKDYRLF